MRWCCWKCQSELSLTDEFREVLIAQSLRLPIHQQREAPKRHKVPGTKLQDDGDQNLPIHFAFRARLDRDFLQRAAKGRGQGGNAVDDWERE